MVKLKELAELVGAQLVGDETLEISRVAPIEQAGPGELCFLANPRYAAKLADCRASAVIVAPGVESPGHSLLISANPYLAFARILAHLQPPPQVERRVMEGAWVDPSAQVGGAVSIHPGCYVGRNVRIGRGSVLYPGVVLYEGVQVGEDCVLHANVVVREECRIGDRVILQPGAVIGSDGFGYAPDGRRYVKIPQVGIVEIEDDVEIGAASCIDRATLSVTRIARGTKIDNLVQIAHNVRVGEDTIIVSQVGVSGSTHIGDHCTFGGQAGLAGHIRIGDDVTIAARGGVHGDIPAGQVMSGTPVMQHRDWLKASMTFPKLPEIRRDVQSLKKKLAELENLIKEK
ncbi:UDP-3-O-[3-hydroxymyristoyl] glucosamine N-acyltransferase [Geoalkalibacter ferrihydriticus]|uniref:UDP-3-O-acylglucosamine N-acyltransferase n=2 Tax=Geoalkalibacter ferrihydriticus TaxID=392333 RepID=A0A0C2HFQ8_9BACT|nr:UDP-3-O-(3-hydroxymyristoyl)glucosamine N-acyltransferase [Geoalkalibacter ferrihydriticus]KIH75756.1 UDP-3-O-(3-hydroxymyristoyl) glucosamine N-acyltransferase [Geoalkalibacter ferrihydriticus DSM 17813]SDM63611.1 UDP-3-O-[3-hydroxymyristoyl] glucosamine N-acyltransferase [Geoalkalibacter ferrihydriticus]